MNSINTLATRMGVSTPTADPLGTSQTACTIPAAHFSHHHVLGDGDCLFRAMYMGLFNQPGVEPSQDQVMGLRQYLANYVYQHQDTLANNPAFEGRQGLQSLYDLLLTQGQWNHNAGDLVAPLLAQVTGRSLAVLQALQNGTAYSVRQVFPADNPVFPSGAPATGEPTICLAHVNGSHYNYLEERYPGSLSGVLNQPLNSPQPIQRSIVPSLPLPSPSLQIIEPAEITNNDPVYKKHGKGKLSHTQAQEMAELWRNNPSWGVRKIADEFMQRNPGLNITKSITQTLKARHPDLQGLDLGFKVNQKKANDAQLQEIVQLWSAYPSWGSKKIVSEVNKRKLGFNLPENIARTLKNSHPDLRDLGLGGQKRQKLLSQAQEKEMIQLWAAHPDWGERKIANEFMKHYPELNMTKGVVHGLKTRHPSLRGIGLGSTKRQKVTLNDDKEREMAKLWQANPSWGELTIAQEFMQRNPGLTVTRGVADRLKAKFPELLQDADAATRTCGKKLSFAQEKQLAAFCLENPSWCANKIAKEFNQIHPGLAVSSDIIYRLKRVHPDLKGQPVLRASKTAPPGQQREHIEKQLNLLSHKMQSLESLVQGDENIKSQYKSLQADFRSLQRSLYYVTFKELLSTDPAAKKGLNPVSAQGLASTSQRQSFMAEHDAPSQGTFAALSDIAGADDLFLSSSSSAGSQGTFAALEDFEDVSRLRD